MGTGASAVVEACQAASNETLAETLTALSAKDRARIAEALKRSQGADDNLPVGLRHISSRHCTHNFDRTRPVPREFVRNILEGSRSVPTSANTQPWTIFVAQGAIRDRLSEAMLAKFDRGDDGEAQYTNRPK